MQRRELPVDWDAELALFSSDAKGLAKRDLSDKVSTPLPRITAWLIGGSTARSMR